MYELNFTKSDCEIIELALSIFPVYQQEIGHISSAQAQRNSSLCISAAKKLFYRRTDFSINEWRVITAGLILMQEIARGEISADAETKAESSKYFIPIGILLSKLPELPT